MRRSLLPVIATFVAPAAVIVIVILAMHPELLVRNTTTTGGDTGSHVALAAFMASNLLPHLHMTGWDPGWYDGFPLFTFYFPFPDMLAALGSYVIPGNIAFKFVTILGSVTLPIAAWAFGRLAGLERPRPALLAAFTLPFLFDQTFEIYGGNLLSTMAGEYAYSLGLSVALLLLGVVLYGMRTGRLRWLAAVLFAVGVVCHLVTTLFAIVGVVIIFFVSPPSWKRAWWIISSVGTAALLSAWWWVPFILQQAYTTSMGYTNVDTFIDILLPQQDRWALVLGAIGALIGVLRRQRGVMVLAGLAVLAMLAVRFDPQGKLYNVRFLPLWFFCAYLLAGIAVAEVLVFVAQRWRRARIALWRATVGLKPAWWSSQADEGWPPDVPEPALPRKPKWRWAPAAVGGPIVGTLIACAVVVPSLVVPYTTTSWNFGLYLQKIPIIPEIHIRHNYVTDWAEWNYTGYQGKPAWPEFSGLMTTMSDLAAAYGCGRAMWEYNDNLDRFGTPESLMDLPMWTNGCVDSMEGLLFESASTTPFHFINQAELSVSPSEAMTPQDGLTYSGLDIPLGIQHLQLLGVKYFMASSPAVQEAANADPSLTQIATSGPWNSDYEGTNINTTWKIYLVKDSQLVTALTKQPIVLSGVGNSQSQWLPTAVNWYADPTEWPTELTDGGLATWKKEKPPINDPPSESVQSKSLPAVQVTDIRQTNGGDSISFHVNRIGVPVLVKISYFPDWHALGADGPWRAEPNLMVVVPTSHNVTLSYGSSSSSDLGDFFTLLGIIALIVLLRRRSVLTFL
ncbi:MAG: hypothetical protein WAM97_05625 [Acidimicrobiales bacterium]